MRDFTGLSPSDLEAIIEEQDQELETLKAQLQKARDVAYEAPELNMSNYSHEDVDKLNNGMIEVFDILENGIQ
ncbi:hypothetical protein [Neptuniibacter sp. QD37_11]|uniref:hypothetical protein n=1 Tax=Neptuniibacter sp. QD37_11 TaxID=3398209 RepID=UPI0039F628DC